MRARSATLLVFLVLALLPVALFGHAGPWPGGEAPQFRPLAPFPPRLAPNTFRRIGDWFADHLGLRNPLLVIGSELSWQTWRPRVRAGAMVGRNAWIFYAGGASERTRFGDRTVAEIDATLRAVRDAYAACRKEVLGVVAPNKQSIYPEELAEGSGTTPSRFDDLKARLGPQTRPMLGDLRPPLRAAKPEGVPVYYKTDTHWNDLGAFYAYRAIVEMLARRNAIERPELASLAQYEIVMRPFSGDLAVRLLNLPWHLAESAPFLVARSTLPQFSVEEGPHRTTFRNPAGTGRLLLQGDSFGPALARYFAPHYAEVTVLWRTNEAQVFDGAQTAAYRADVTIYEIVERNLHELANPPQNLTQVCTR